MISQILDLGFHFPVLCSCLMAKRFKKILHWASYTYHTVSGGVMGGDYRVVEVTVPSASSAAENVTASLTGADSL
jgi:hypothetical protein